MTTIPNGEVSASKFNTAFGRAGCGMKFYYRYIEGLRGPVTASLLAGIAFDRATSQLHEYRMGVEMPAPDLEAAFVDAWENPDEENRDGEPVEFDLSDAPSDILERGANALKTYEQQTEGMVVTDVQVKVEAGFEETDAKLIGFIDLVERIKPGYYAVTDVKTSLSSRKKWAADEAVRDAQLNIYAVLWQNQNPTETVAALGWRHARLGGKVEVGATHVQMGDQTPIMQRVSYWMGELERWCESGNFPATGLDKDAWVCSEKYCDYYNKCPYGRKAQQIIPITIGGIR